MSSVSKSDHDYKQFIISLFCLLPIVSSCYG